MKTSFWRGRFIPLLLLAFPLFHSCGDLNGVGSDIFPPSDQTNIVVIDTFKAKMHSIRTDSSLTGPLSQILFGVCADPEFGTLSADGYLQFQISGSNITFGDTANLSFDSLILSMDLVGVYGRYDHPQELIINEINDPSFVPDSTYYSDKQFPVWSQNLSPGYFLDFSSFSGFFDTRIPLDASLGNKLMLTPQTVLNDPIQFRNYFNGIRIKSLGYSGASREQGAVFSMNSEPGTGTTKLTLYYHLDSTAKSYDFQITTSSGRFSHINRSLITGTLLDFEENLVNPNYHFVQAGSVIKTFIHFPGIDSLKPGIVHEAIIKLKVDPAYLGSMNRFEPPRILKAFLADSTGFKEDNSFLPVDLTYDTGLQAYLMKFPSTLMRYLDGTFKNYGFILIPDKSGSTLNRAVLGSPNHPTLYPELEIIYSSIPAE